jgi:ethanolamine ammonia-lyase small subunit
VSQEPPKRPAASAPAHPPPTPGPLAQPPTPATPRPLAQPLRPAHSPPPPIDPFARLRNSTPARIGLGRCGHGLPTAALLEFQLAHARARDAVHEQLDPAVLKAALGARETITVHSQAPDRQTYLQRPDLGRQLLEADATRLTTSGHAAAQDAASQRANSDRSSAQDAAGQRTNIDCRGKGTAGQDAAAPESPSPYDLAVVIADGLSATAVHTHAAPLLQTLFPKLPDWHLAPLVIACQARVALGDEIGSRLGATLVVVLIGERPGLSAPDSLGAYLTWHPRQGRQDSERNCISNIRPPTGLSYEQAASRIAWLLSAARRQKLTGVALKDTSAIPTLPSQSR